MSDAPKTVPITVASPMEDNLRPAIVIGNDDVAFDGKPQSFGGYWIVVVDRRTLRVVYNQYTAEYDKAPDIGKYDTTDYMLVVGTTMLGTGHVPQGAFYDFLYDNGAGRALKRIVQLNDTLGCGTYAPVAYALLGVLGPGKPDMPGVEASMMPYNPVGLVLTAQLVPVEIGDTTYYTPFPLSD